MLNAPAPDMDRLISGGRARRRRRTLARTGIAAALVAVLGGGGAYGVMQLDSGTAVEPAQPPSTTSPKTYRDRDGESLEPGTYRMTLGVDASGVPIGADLTFDDEAWNANDFPVLYDAGSYGGVAAYQPTALAAGNGCSNKEPDREVAGNPQALAEQLARLPRSTVAQAPAPVQALGRDAVHLRLRIDNDCGDYFYRVAESDLGERQHGISYNTAAAKEVVIDFWVFDIDGEAVVVDTWHEADATTELRDQLARVRDSITFPR